MPSHWRDSRSACRLRYCRSLGLPSSNAPALFLYHAEARQPHGFVCVAQRTTGDPNPSRYSRIGEFCFRKLRSGQAEVTIHGLIEKGSTHLGAHALEFSAFEGYPAGDAFCSCRSGDDNRTFRCPANPSRNTMSIDRPGSVDPQTTPSAFPSENEQDAIHRAVRSY